MKMNISYCISCCNETDSLKSLLLKLHSALLKDDEILVVIDKDNYSKETEEILLTYQSLNKENGNFKIFYHPLNKNYAAFKNVCIEKSKKEYCIHIDADELPPDGLIYHNLKYIIESNPEVELFWIPRINNFTGVTNEDASKWGWDINNPNKWVNWASTGDYQGRIFKRDYPRIKWVGKLHERIEGYKKYAFLPKEEEYALLHIKTIERQRETNLKYNKNFTLEENLGHKIQ